MPARHRRIAGQNDPLVRSALARGSGAAARSVTSAIDAAALSASAVSVLQIGSWALVQTFGAYFSLQPATSFSITPSIILATPSPALVWVRVLTAVAEKTQAQRDVWFDPENVTGHANNENDGVTAASPLRDYAEIVRRWGTSSPQTKGVTLHFLSSHTDASDPVLFTPVATLDNSVESNNIVVVQGELGVEQIVGSGSITVDAPKADPVTLWTVILPAPSAGPYQRGQLIVNMTHASRALLKENISGTTWTVTQPVANYQPIYGGAAGAPIEVAWTTGDQVSVYSTVAINLVTFDAIPASILPAADDYAFLYQATIFDPGTEDFQASNIGRTVDVFDCFFERIPIYQPGSAPFSSFWINAMAPAGIAGGQVLATGLLNGPVLLAGMYGGGEAAGIVSIVKLQGCTLDMDVIVAQDFASIPVTAGETRIGSCYVDVSTTLNVADPSTLSPGIFSSVAKLWGPGAVNPIGAARFAYSGGAAADLFVLTGGLKLNGARTACSVAANTLQTGIALDPDALDAPAGPSGFGGLAFNLGGASYVAGTS